MATYNVVQQKRIRRTIAFLRRTIYYLVSGVLALLFLFPLLWTALTTFKTSAESQASPPTFWPSQFSLEGYTALFGVGAGVLNHLGNSLFVTLVTVVLSVLLSAFAGYGFARFPFRGQNIIFVLILTALMIPYNIILTPIFIVLHYIGLQNTLIGLALVYTTFSLPFSTFMMRNAFENVPNEIQEAALIDGCTPLTMLYRIMLPIAYPGAITVGLFTFFFGWNEFLAALIFLSDSDKYTLPIYLVGAQSGQYGTVNWNAVQAGVVISALPCILLFLLLQRYYIRGLASGAVKA